MDPQFRQLLLHSWQAVEDAGYVAKEIPETCVFVSTSNGPSQGGAPVRVSRCSNIKNSDVLESSGDYVTYLLSQSGSIPTMISYQLGLKGPVSTSTRTAHRSFRVSFSPARAWEEGRPSTPWWDLPPFPMRHGMGIFTSQA